MDPMSPTATLEATAKTVAKTAAQAALVTGSTSGIGLAIARALAAAGRNIVLTGFGDLQQLNDLALELSRQYAVDALFIPADVRKPEQIRSLAAAALRRFGVVDILVNNVGIQHVALLHEFPDEHWDDILAVNLSSAFHATKAVLPGMQARGWGRVINIASSHGLVGSPGKSAYVATKHGLVGLTKVTALENAEFGITANAICPGWTRTAIAEKQVSDRASRSGRSLDEEETLLLAEKQAIKRFTTPEQIAEFAVFLCSSAASTLTGAALSMDGGWVAI
jgi:3-hydroxybutyrate dehydrogenase